jgi:hypothetical protein
MAQRRPLYFDSSGNLRTYKSTHINSLRTEFVRQYALDPSVILTVTPGTGNLNTLQDTRLQAGSALINTDFFPPENTTPEPSIVTVNYRNVTQTYDNLSKYLSEYSERKLLYYDNNTTSVRTFSTADLVDTFLNPVLNGMLSTNIDSTVSGGTYYLSFTRFLSEDTLISSTPVHLDTRADPSAYNAASIPTPLDSPVDNLGSYLYRIDPPPSQTFPIPIYVKSDGNLRSFAREDFEIDIRHIIRNYIADNIEYELDLSTSSGFF